ncbi:unnamed protein product [Strongylus vulgaris]|uniref:Lipoyl-binding domain-containing protein n=1 Tax=Strongylus vulgaris TaxID=40348 RepID=A0A3P7I9N5_STRVU|nr:unnamed protein product [Strongylus vulgaris]
MIGRRVPAIQRCAINIARQRLSASLSPCRCIFTPSRSLSVSTRVPTAHLSFVPIRAIHASGIRLADVIVVKGPDFAESISEGDIRWIKKVGDFVNEDELVAEIETDKVAVVIILQVHIGKIDSRIDHHIEHGAESLYFKLLFDEIYCFSR